MTTAFVPLAIELGEAFQFDWSEEGLVVGGIYYRLQVSHLKLCASRAFWLVAYPSQGNEMLFDGTYSGGIEAGTAIERGRSFELQSAARTDRLVYPDGAATDKRLGGSVLSIQATTAECM